MTTSRDDHHDDHQDNHQGADPGLAQVRTSLAWTRTALSFAAVGAVTLKEDVIPGLLIMATAMVIWRIGPLAYHHPARLRMVTIAIVAVAAVALGVALTH